jgi:catechol 2,3-dioxygenase-like lactoylglutathione lyase family enzyme
MVRTHGLTHVGLAVVDPERSLRFCRDVFGVVEYFRDETAIQVQGPGPFDGRAPSSKEMNLVRSALARSRGPSRSNAGVRRT